MTIETQTPHAEVIRNLRSARNAALERVGQLDAEALRLRSHARDSDIEAMALRQEAERIAQAIEALQAAD